ncbi:RES family NAD+ phosphorylase [Hymenobacter profundi]|uniref:RES family NAD+ phosphorylase n=1 Tax=Hymenobacter profundi TaxID=1982110 RepID=A0ABS6X4T1_9BACT|nr:RES family NAD+ phosphorylase [Hymenobacter profundi]MBW3130850.1 RES family NAD+ phosphorylase [Hymenobacter profundi]
MLVFRLARANRRYDLSGWGAYLVGGRWNLPGLPVLYTAESRALAAMEVLVHLPSDALPDDMYLLTLEVPDELSRETLSVTSLPGNWRQLSQPQPTAELGSKWLRSGSSVALRVPSVLVPQEYNLLLNPAHSEFGQVKLTAEPEPFHFDERLRKG